MSSLLFVASIPCRATSLLGLWTLKRSPCGGGFTERHPVALAECLVVDGKFEWEVNNYLALFVSDDKRATVRGMSIKNPLAHALASRLYCLIPYRFVYLQTPSLLTRPFLPGLRWRILGWLAGDIWHIPNPLAP